MSRFEETMEKLDREFEHHLQDMKPYFLKNPNSKDCNRSGLWIKKLCDSSSSSSNPDIKALKVRNSYSRLLLQMLKRGRLEAPFTYKPESGPLKTLPAYLSIYFEDEPSRKPEEQNKLDPCDWLTEELGATADDSMAAGLRSPRSPSSLTLYRRMLRQETPPEPTTSSPIKQHSPRREDRTGAGGLGVDVSAADSDLEARVNSWILEVESPRYLPENAVSFSPIAKSKPGKETSTVDDPETQLEQIRKMEVKIKLLEAKHQEDKLKMQQIHDAAVENILERKNGEMDQMRGVYRAKMKELEEMNHELEMRVQRTIQESQVIQRSQDVQIAELRKTLDQSCLKDELERKLRVAAAGFDRQKVELQKKQTTIIQELVDETNLRLTKVEAICEARCQSAEQAARDLELRLKQKSVELEKVNASTIQEKAQLEIHAASLGTELQEAINRVKVLQKEKEKQKETYEEMFRRCETKHDNEMSHLHQKHTLSAAQDAEKREVLEKAIADLHQQLLVSEHERQRAARDKDFKSQLEMEELRMTCEKRVSAIQSETEKERAAAKREMAKIEDALREKDGQLNRERENQRKQILQAAEKFKTQMETQEKEYCKQLKDLKKSHELQMAEQRMQYEQARTRQQEQHCAEKDSLVQERQREVSTLEKEARATLQQHQERTQELKKRDAQRIFHLEAQLSSLRDDLELDRVQHEQQLAEMTLRHEEEKQRALLDKKKAMERLHLDTENLCNDLKRRYQNEEKAIKEATSSSLKRMEQEFSQKLAKSSQLVAEVRNSICESKEESIRMQEGMKQRLEDAHIRWDQERTELIQNSDQSNQALQKKVESLERQLSLSENKLLRKELETEEKVTLVHQEYAQKMEALIPVEIQNELENTIAALKSQVQLLQQRNSVLQYDLDASRAAS